MSSSFGHWKHQIFFSGTSLEKVKVKDLNFAVQQSQTFSLANGHVQTPLGKVVWNCTLHGHQYPFRAFVKKDQGLTLSIILGQEFLMDSGIQIDFKDKPLKIHLCCMLLQQQLVYIWHYL